MSTVTPRTRRETVLFIHGINDNGRWELVRVFEPFFVCRQLRHRYYHCRGEIKFVCWLWAILFILALIATLLGRDSLLEKGDSRGWGIYALGGVVIVAVCLCAAAEASWSGFGFATALPVLLGVVSILIAWNCQPRYGCLGFWLMLAALAVYLEWREHAREARFPFVYLLMLPCAILTWWLLLGSTIKACIAGPVLFVGIVVAGGWEASRRRRRAIDQAKSLIGGGCASAKEPHLIGHSLGTFLTGHVLREDPAIKLGRIVFLGSLLPREFDWEEVLPPARDRPAFEQLRNEVGGRDRAVRLAAALGQYGLPFGDAGLVGFTGESIHTCRSGLLRCRKCDKEGWVHVHNIRLPHADHSSAFLHTEHARTFWLPYIWGIEPSEHDVLVTVCQRAAFAYDCGDHSTRNHQADILKRRRWRWCVADGPLGKRLWEILFVRFGCLSSALPPDVRRTLSPWFTQRREAVEETYRRLSDLLASEVADAFEALSRYILLPRASLTELRTWFLDGGKLEDRELELGELSGGVSTRALRATLRERLEPELVHQAASLYPFIAFKRAVTAALLGVYQQTVGQVR
jgi:hypothetical protein